MNFFILLIVVVVSSCPVTRFQIEEFGVFGKWRNIEELSDYNLNTKSRYSTVTIDSVPCSNSSCCNVSFYVRPYSTDLQVIYDVLPSLSKYIPYLKSKIGAKKSYILDGGSNIGIFSAVMAMAFPMSTIYSCEMNQFNYLIMKKNTAMYTNVVAINVALWDRNSTRHILSKGARRQDAYTLKPSPKNESHSLGEVNTTTVDHIMKYNLVPKFDIVKIDIEGSEVEVFQSESVSKWLTKTSELLIEYHQLDEETLDDETSTMVDVEPIILKHSFKKVLPIVGGKYRYINDNA